MAKYPSARRERSNAVWHHVESEIDGAEPAEDRVVTYCGRIMFARDANDRLLVRSNQPEGAALCQVCGEGSLA